MDLDGASEAERSTVVVELLPAGSLGYAAVVSLCGEHDVGTSGAIAGALAPIRGNVLVDLSGCEFIDSSVITALIDKFRALERDACRLELVVPPSVANVTRIIDVIGLRTLIAVHDRSPVASQPERALP